MSSQRTQQISENATLIDLELFGIRRVGAVYLVRAGRTCLIDSGTRAEAKNLIRALDSIGAFPPDLLILTHSHYDHSQGTPVLCTAARKRGRNILVMASEKALANLRDQSWNRVFDAEHDYEDIPGVVPLKDGQTLDLGGLELEIRDFAGHCADDVAVCDEKNKTVFVGDSVGYRIESTLSFPPFMPPFWNPEGFRAAANALKRIDYDKLCLAHFGCLRGEEAQRYPDEAVETYDAWWKVFSEADRVGRLDDVAYLKDALIAELGLALPELEVSKLSMRVLLTAVNLFKRALGREPVRVAEEQMKAILGWLAEGYRGHRARAAAGGDDA